MEVSVEWEIDNLSWTDAELDVYFARISGIRHRFYNKIRELIDSHSTRYILNLHEQIAKMR